MKDWIGNSRSVCTPNVRSSDAEKNDYYATNPEAVKLLLKHESFSDTIWEPACGEGHISKELEAHGYTVFSTDLVDRGFGEGNEDFLSPTSTPPFPGDIITNPPYKYAREFVEKALQIITPSHKVAMFLKLTFLEGQQRKQMFQLFPPKTVYVSSKRLKCGKNGRFDGDRSAVAYCWIVWEKGWQGTTNLKWL